MESGRKGEQERGVWKRPEFRQCIGGPQGLSARFARSVWGLRWTSAGKIADQTWNVRLRAVATASHRTMMACCSWRGTVQFWTSQGDGVGGRHLMTAERHSQQWCAPDQPRSLAPGQREDRAEEKKKGTRGRGTRGTRGRAEGQKRRGMKRARRGRTERVRSEEVGIGRQVQAQGVLLTALRMQHKHERIAIHSRHVCCIANARSRPLPRPRNSFLCVDKLSEHTPPSS